MDEISEAIVKILRAHAGKPLPSWQIYNAAKWKRRVGQEEFLIALGKLRLSGQILYIEEVKGYFIPDTETQDMFEVKP